MLTTHFSNEQLLPLLLGGGILVISILVFNKSTKLSLTLLALGSISIGFFAAGLNNFLDIWDEQFHALVAKNMANEPLAPKLYAETILSYDYKNWTENSIWLHKQPLFLWQMALSIKLFGANEVAVRLPSIILHAIIPLFVYRIGKISINRQVGYIAAILMSLSYFPLELIAGRYATDHNDIAFLFYVTGSFWAWFEYQRTKSNKYLILVGFFSGCAVLVKWLMGLLVFVIWSIVELFISKQRVLKKENLFPIIKSGLVSLVVFIPWQIYIHITYPKEAGHELALNGQHFFEAVEGHTGDWNFHFSKGLKILYGSGDLIPIFLLIGLIIFVLKSQKKAFGLFATIAVAFVYIFFSIAATKMNAFTVVVMPFIYLGLAALIFTTIQWIQNKTKKELIGTILTPLFTIIFGFTALNMSKLENYHTTWKPNDNQGWHEKTAWKKNIISLANQLDDPNYVIFNTSITPFGNVSVMFYTDFLAYYKIPSKEEVSQVKNSGKKIAIFNTGNLPEYILQDTTIIKIPYSLPVAID